jgi:hypothetical protein
MEAVTFLVMLKSIDIYTLVDAPDRSDHGTAPFQIIATVSVDRSCVYSELSRIFV